MTTSVKEKEEAGVPRLPGWMLLSEVAEECGVARQTVNRWAAEGRLKTLKKLGADHKPIYVVSTKEVDRIAATEPVNGRRSRTKRKK